jgi:hypothetical protein
LLQIIKYHEPLFNLNQTMKKLNYLFMSALVCGLLSCTYPVDPITDEPTENIIEGKITSNLTLDASKKYLLRGKVYVQAPNTITIPAGTLIMGEKSTDGTLIINRGAKIMAEGTADKPIIMTSQAPKGFRNRGDWGGVVICGNAYTNGNTSSTIEGITGTAGSENGLYGPGSGAAQDNQNSGVMKYCRIEFAGIDLSQDNELNSLTMGSVGSGTQIHHIMISYANDDAYEWFGGSNNHSYLIAYNTLDDDFDSDRGYNGKVQYGLIVRKNDVADISTSRAFEASSNNNAEVERHSAPKFANITLMGPRLFSNNIDPLYGAAVEINSNSSMEVHNSIITGFPIGTRFNTSGANAKVKGNIFVENNTLVTASGGSTVPASFETDNIIGSKDNLFAAAPNFANPNPLLSSNSPYKEGAPNLSAMGFEVQPFYGAFGTSAHAGWDWGKSWIEFNPINADY